MDLFSAIAPAQPRTAKPKTWTVEEDCRLQLLLRECFDDVSAAGEFNESSEVASNLQQKLGGEERSTKDILDRLVRCKFLNKVGRRPVRFALALQNKAALFCYSCVTPHLNKPLRVELCESVLGMFDGASMDRGIQEVIRDIAVAAKLNDLQVEKVLFERGAIWLNEESLAIEFSTKDQIGLAALIQKKSADPDLVKEINKYRAEASKLYHVHDRPGAEVVFSCDGTGFGKSYGVIQGYVEYLETLSQERDIADVSWEDGFTNLVFMSPQKSQIDFDASQKQKISKAGAEFLSVLARADTFDPNFVNWVTGESNSDRYKCWFAHRKGQDRRRVRNEFFNLDRIFTEIKFLTEKIERLERLFFDGSSEEKESSEKLLKIAQDKFESGLVTACKKIIEETGGSDPVREIVSKGISSRCESLGLGSSSLSLDEVVFELVKQVLPFEVCSIVPSVLMMTTSKFDTKSRRMSYDEKKNSVSFQSVGFDHLIGGKLKPEEPKISTLIGEDHETQVEYLRNEHFRSNSDCRFRKSGIQFTVVIDELHESYNLLQEKSHVSLINDQTNLASVLSAISRMYRAATRADFGSIPNNELNDFEAESRKFIGDLRTALSEKCELSEGVELHRFSSLFLHNFGSFEVCGDHAEQIVAITRNVFSFNAKMFTNEESLKRIRLRNPRRDETRVELYYEVEGSEDDNLSLHDLFQMLGASLWATSKIHNRHFKSWVKNGGLPDVLSQNAPFAQFVDVANKVSSEVGHIFDRAIDEDILVDHFYAYFQPKTVFSMVPVEELNYVNAGAEKSITLNFRMDLIKELPEVMLLRLLSGTNNKVIGLSATSGFSSTKNGTFNRAFLDRFRDCLGFRVVERGVEHLEDLRGVRENRGKIRKLNLQRFDAEEHCLTDIREKSLSFSDVYKEFEVALKRQLGHSWSNPYKKRQYKRELEALLLAAYDGKNSLVLSLSGGFKTAFVKAFQENETAWKRKFRMSSECDVSTGAKLEKILSFVPFAGKPAIRLVFFDAALARSVDVRAHTYIQDTNTVLVFMSTYNSAGTGLNYFVKYHEGELSNESAMRLDEDFERLVIINSSFYSEVFDKGTWNTLSNYVTILKHLADDTDDFRVSDIGSDFNSDPWRRILQAEHDMSLFKVLVQAFGRVERRDTVMETEIMVPSDVMSNIVYQHNLLNSDSGDEVVRESMSLLNFEIGKESRQIAEAGSFETEAERKTFEKRVVKTGRLIEECHRNVLSADWINRVRGGDEYYLGPCNMFRSPLSLKDPAAWLRKLKSFSQYRGDPLMMGIHNDLFLDVIQDGKEIVLSHKKGRNGLPVKGYAELSDFTGGAKRYAPELAIFPQYTKTMEFGSGNIVGKIMKDIDKFKGKAFSKMLPHPCLVPLLRGNMGEYIFDRVLAEMGIVALTDKEVFDRLTHQVYEYFDRFIEVEVDGLKEILCIDVKRWSTRNDSYWRSAELLEKGRRKISQVCAKSGSYSRVRFVYLNADYSSNSESLMSEENSDHSVYFLNMFQEIQEYYQMRDREKGYLLDKQKLRRTLDIHPRLKDLLSAAQRRKIPGSLSFEPEMRRQGDFFREAAA
jgi:hypothetical protein